jgi:hypothetical protein
MRFFNIFVSIWYTGGVIMEIYYGVQGNFFIIDIIFVFIGIIVMFGVFLANFT